MWYVSKIKNPEFFKYCFDSLSSTWKKKRKKKLNFKSTLRLYGPLFVVKQLLFYHYLLIILFWEGVLVGWSGSGGLRMKIYMIHKLVKNKNKNSEINNVQNKWQQVYSIWNHWVIKQSFIVYVQRNNRKSVTLYILLLTLFNFNSLGFFYVIFYNFIIHFE